MKKWISKAGMVLIMGNAMMPTVHAQSELVTSSTEVELATEQSNAVMSSGDLTDYIKSTAYVSTQQSESTLTLKINRVTPQETVQQVDVVVWSREDQGDAHEYTAKLVDGYYQVDIDPLHHEFEASHYKAQIVITHTNGVVDQLVTYTMERQTSQDETVLESDKSARSEQEPLNEEVQFSPSQAAIIQQVDATQTKPTGSVRVTNVNQTNGTFDVIVSNVRSSAGVKEVLVPVWADVNGQNDLKWYSASRQADGTYKVTVAATNHKNELGHYHVHAYVVQSNQETHILATTTTNLAKDNSKAVVTFQNKDDRRGTVDIIISNVQHAKGVRQVLVPIWSDQNGQDDLVWYVAQRQGNGTYKISLASANHKNQLGLYHIHVYYGLNDQSQVNAAVQTVDVKADLRTSATVAISNVNVQAETFDVVVSNVYSPTEVKQVLVPVWSEVNDQNDLRWYVATKQANGTYKVSVRVADHKGEFGKYHAHVYVNGNTFAGNTTAVIEQAKPTGKASVVNSSSYIGAFDIVVSDVQSPIAVKEVLIPVWSNQNGQDDLRWYTATKQANGTYKASIDVSEHQFNKGAYTAHVYYKLANGAQSGVASLQHHVNITNPNASANVVIANRDDKYGSFEVVIDKVYAPKGMKTLKVPIWGAQGGQNDLRWYEAIRRNDGKFVVNVDVKNHKYEVGDYHIHVYVEQNDKSQPLAHETAIKNLKWTAYRPTKTVYLDAGHGGKDSGAVANGLKEKDLNLEVSNKVKARLEAAGYKVVTTRTTDTYTDFRTEISKKANASNADLFVSIHFNAGGGKGANGIETFWYENDPTIKPKINSHMHNNAVRLKQSERLANLMQKNLIATTKATDRKVKRESFAVLRETEIPAVLLELGFVDNVKEAGIIKEDSYKNKLADAIVKSLIGYYNMY